MERKMEQENTPKIASPIEEHKKNNGTLATRSVAETAATPAKPEVSDAKIAEAERHADRARRHKEEALQASHHLMRAKYNQMAAEAAALAAAAWPDVIVFHESEEAELASLQRFRRAGDGDLTLKQLRHRKAEDDWMREVRLREAEEAARDAQARQNAVAQKAKRLPWDNSVEELPQSLLDDPPLERPAAPQITRQGDTEDLLNGMIAECHFLMREGAFRSICQTGQIGERLHLLTAAQKMALAGSKVGRSIAKLRLADALIERGSQQSVRRFASERAGNHKNPQIENDDHDVAAWRRMATKDRREIRQQKCAQNRAPRSKGASGARLAPENPRLESADEGGAGFGR
jgi:hypothetical protein